MLKETPIDSVGRRICFVTENSVFILEGDKFCRTPRNGTTREALDTIEGKQFDGDWKEFDTAVLVSGNAKGSIRHYIRIVPSGRWPGARGIESSYIQGIYTYPVKENSND